MPRTSHWLFVYWLLALGGLPPAWAQEPDDNAEATVLHAGTVLLVPGEPPAGPHTIVVRGGRIAVIESGFQPAKRYGAASRLIDLSDRFVLPGLIDLHMHLAIIGEGFGASHSRTELALAAAGYAADLLRAGVTTVRDVGDNSEVTFALREAFASGALAGPRVLAAGRIVSRTGGHGAKPPGPADSPHEPVACDGQESCRRAVRRNVERGSDWIKLTVSGSGREATGRADAAPILFPDEVTAAASAAQQAQRPLAAHAHSTAAIELALESGARTIEHGTYFDARSAALFRRRDAYLIPTAFVADFVRSKLDFFAGGEDGRSVADLRSWADAAIANPGRAWRSGVPLGLGTDGGPSFPTDSTAREIALYVNSGVPVAEAIRAATSTNAKILGMADRLGHIRPGYIADMIATDGSPLEDPARLRGPVFVMKEGVVHKYCRLANDNDCGMPGAPGASPQ